MLLRAVAVKYGIDRPVLWQNALRYVSQRYLSYTGDAARRYALAESALAEAQIACRDSKYSYNYWRPIPWQAARPPLPGTIASPAEGETLRRNGSGVGRNSRRSACPLHRRELRAGRR